MFRIRGPELQRLCVAAKAIESRVEKSQSTLLTVEELQQFINTRANDIRITEPRLAKIGAIDEDIARLFNQLVDANELAAMAQTRTRHESEQSILLRDTFTRLIESNRAFNPQSVNVPVRERLLDIPYAYQNGRLNLVKPTRFRNSPKLIDTATLLAVDGDLLFRHPEGELNRQLVVVSEGDSGQRTQNAEDNVEPVFAEYNVRLVRSRDVAAFLQEVESQAHP